MAGKKPKDTTVLDIPPIHTEWFRATLRGETPLIMHRFGIKSWRELLLPSQKKNAAAKATDLKHDPLEEYRQCMYINRDPKEETLVHYPSGAFSKAIAAAALDLPGASKSQILRLVWLKSMQINVYGVPQLGMHMIRNSDMARTPDVRTRAFFPEWTCTIDVEYVKSLLQENHIGNLLGAAGKIIGLGDYRPQKGGQYGKFVMVPSDDPNVLRIRKQARAVQQQAFLSPTTFDDETDDLFTWFNEEIKRREKVLPSSVDSEDLQRITGRTVIAAAVNAKRKGNGKRARN